VSRRPRDAGAFRRRVRIETLGHGAVDQNSPLLLQQNDKPLLPLNQGIDPSRLAMEEQDNCALSG
jgi:hypothetical protein